LFKEEIIHKLELHPSRLDKEKIIFFWGWPSARKIRVCSCNRSNKRWWKKINRS